MLNLWRRPRTCQSAFSWAGSAAPLAPKLGRKSVDVCTFDSQELREFLFSPPKAQIDAAAAEQAESLALVCALPISHQSELVYRSSIYKMMISLVFPTVGNGIDN
jgi:hypothetical protein